MPLIKSRFAFVALVVIGAVLVFGGQAFTSYWFGVTWARAVLDVDYAASEHIVYHHLVTQTVVLFGTTGALGAIVASIICAFMIRGSGGCAPIVTATRVVWALYLVLFFLVMLAYWNQQYDTMDPEKSNADCKAVYGVNPSTKDNDKVLINEVDVCAVRFWTYIIGVVILGLSLLFPLWWKLRQLLCGKKAAGSSGTEARESPAEKEEAGASDSRTALLGNAGRQSVDSKLKELALRGAQPKGSDSSESAPFRFPGNNVLRPDMRVGGYAQHVNGLDNFLRSPQGQAMKPVDIRYVSRR